MSDRPNWGGEGVRFGSKWIEPETDLNYEHSRGLASIRGKKVETVTGPLVPLLRSALPKGSMKTFCGQDFGLPLGSEAGCVSRRRSSHGLPTP